MRASFPERFGALGRLFSRRRQPAAPDRTALEPAACRCGRGRGCRPGGEHDDAGGGENAQLPGHVGLLDSTAMNQFAHARFTRVKRLQNPAGGSAQTIPQTALQPPATARQRAVGALVCFVLSLSSHVDWLTILLISNIVNHRRACLRARTQQQGAIMASNAQDYYQNNAAAMKDVRNLMGDVVKGFSGLHQATLKAGALSVAGEGTHGDRDRSRRAMRKLHLRPRPRPRSTPAQPANRFSKPQALQ